MSDQQTSNTKKIIEPIGYLTLSQGSVDVLSSNGLVQTITNDGMVFYQDTVIGNHQASGKITFFSGLADEIIFGPEDVIELSGEVFVTDASQLTALAQASVAEVAVLQDAILQGDDPSQSQQAPAAGEEVFQYSLGQSYSVNIDRNPNSLLASYGYDTQGGRLAGLGLPSFGYLTNAGAGSQDTSEIVIDRDNSRALTTTITNFSYEVKGAIPAGFTLDTTTGEWTFAADDPAYASLAAGQVTNLLVVVEATNGQSRVEETIQILLVGSNDDPTATATITTTAVDGQGVVAGQVDGTDVDGDTLSYSLVEEVDGFSLDSNTGAWQFDANDTAYESLALGEQVEVVATIVVSDGQGGTTQQVVNLTVTGANDAPSVTASRVGSRANLVLENGDAITGVINAEDADGDALSYSLKEEVAGFTISASTGEWSFDPGNSAYDELLAGEVKDVPVTVLISDGNGGEVEHSIVVKIVGSNDAPVALESALSITEDSGTVTIDVLSDSYDAEGDNLTITAVSVAQEQGSVVVEDNKILFTPALNFNGDANIQYTISDGQEEDSSQILVSVSPLDDASVISGDTSSFVYEEDNRVTDDRLVYTTGKLEISDVDDSVNASFDTENIIKADGVLGDLTISADGLWTYTLDTANELQSLAEGQTLIETFTVATLDGTTEDISVTVIGQDDASVIAQNDQLLGFSENVLLPVIPFSLTITDVDEGDTPYFESTTLQGEYGYVKYEASTDVLGEGSWAYYYDYDKGQTIESGTISEKFLLTASDGAIYTITVNIRGLNDAPEVAAVAQYAATEGDDILTGQVEATDIDSDSLSYSLTGDTPAGFALANDGSWTFDPQNDAYESLAAGESQTLSIDVEVSDGENIVSQQIQIDLTGVGNEASQTYLEGTQGSDVLIGDAGANVIFGGDDDTADELTGNAGEDTFVLTHVSQAANLDTITDFNGAEDALDLTSLLDGLDGHPEADADVATVTAFLNDHVQATMDGSVKVDDEDVAHFSDEGSNFDSNQDGAVSSLDVIKVIYNETEYSINIDG